MDFMISCSLEKIYKYCIIQNHWIYAVINTAPTRKYSINYELKYSVFINTGRVFISGEGFRDFEYFDFYFEKYKAVIESLFR